MSLLWLGSALASFAFWLVLRFDGRRAWPSGLHLAVPPDGEPGDLPARSMQSTVTVIVPARDEATVIAATLPTILGQSWKGLEVILVDDQSSDGTAEAARRAAGDHSLVIVRADEPRAGWTGKLAALQRGVEEALTRRPDLEWLLFTDADIRHHPGSLAALLRRAADGPFDLVSVMARLHTSSFWERLLIPPFVYFFHLLYPFPAVADPDSRIAAAAGGCVLVRRQALLAAGGLEAIRSALIDDVALAAAVKRSGGGTWLGLDGEIVSIRPYRGLGELWRMVARSAFVQLRFRWDLLLVVLAGLLLVVVAPPLHVVAAATVLAWNGVSRSGVLVLVLGALSWSLEALALRPAVRHHRIGGQWAWTLPLAGLLYGAMTLSSAVDHWRGRGSRWKGRSYS